MNKGYIIVVPSSSWLRPDVQEMGMGTRKINSFSLHLQRPKSSVLNNVTQSNKISNQKLDSANPARKKSALSSAEIFFFWLDESSFFLGASLHASLPTWHKQWTVSKKSFNSFLPLLLMILTVLCFVLGFLTSRVALCRRQVHEIWCLREHCGIAQGLEATHNLNRRLTQTVSKLISLLTFQWKSHSLLPRHIEAKRYRGTPDAMTCQKERLRHKQKTRLAIHVNLRR